MRRLKEIRRWSLNFISTALLTLLGSIYAEAYGQNVAPEALQIELDLKKSNVPSESKQKTAKEFRKSCQNLGKALIVGKGPWGVGVFKSYSCFIDGKKVFGKGVKSPWKMSIGVKKTESEFVLKNGNAVFARLALKKSENIIEAMQDPEIVDQIAYQILDQLPFSIYIDLKKIDKKEKEIKFRHWQTSLTKEFKYSVPKASENLTLYRLRLDPSNDVYKVEMIGSVALKKVDPPKLESKKGKGKKVKILKGGSVTYSISDQILEALKAGPVWAQDSTGPGERSEELTKGVQAASEEINGFIEKGRLKDFMSGNTGLVANILESTASGYVGLRYGLQVLPGDGELGRLLDNTSLFNLVAEVRGGPIEGVRYYYDKLPETKLKLDGADGNKVEAKLAFARHVLGYSWDFAFPFLIDRITIDPKMGVWTFNAFLPVSQDENGLVTDATEFNLGSTASIAIELGAEIISDWFTLRGFYANDSGFSLLKQGGKVTSNRFGGDAFFKAGPQFNLFGVPFKTALLGTFVYESVAIRRGLNNVEDGQTEITGITYSVGYAGGGVAVSW